MSEPFSPAQSDEDSKGILLLEEYDALAIAIASALKKFAPQHDVRLARTLGEAEVAAMEMRPELFVLDLDPPPSGEVDFFNKLRDRFPDARVLVIAAGTSPEMRAERGTAGAVQFIEKPFDLGEFGAAVQALLGPWSAPPNEPNRGTLRDLNVVDIVQLECVAQSTAVVHLEALDGRVGEIHFHHGEICHAETGDFRGVAALEEIVRWRGGKMSESPIPQDAPKTIDTPWPILLLRAVRKTPENGSSQAHYVDPMPAPPEPGGKTILVIDDTEMLLVFAADVLSTANSRFRIVTAASGREGLKLAATLSPDVILLDYSLTDTDGAEVCRELLSDPATARIPVLMMSGHLPELTNTAATYGNVVATLPKPFLSGALIDSVEKILAAGPLATAPPVPPPIGEMSPAAAEPMAAPMLEPEPVVAPPAAILPNEPGNGHPTVETPSSPSLSASPEISAPPAAAAVESAAESVTFLLEVLSMQLTLDFRIDSLHLKPAGGAVGVRVGDEGKIGMLVETGFEMGPAQLTADGKIGTLLLVPTLQPPQLPAGGNSFATSGVRAQTSAQRTTIEISAEPNEPMRIHLTARFELIRLEFSPTFEIIAVVLRARDGCVQVGVGEGAASFEIERVQLDEAGRLSELFVRAIR